MKNQTIIKDGQEYELVPVKKIMPYRLTETKTADIEIYPHDLPETMTYVNAVKAVEALGDGWRIPTLTELRVTYEQKDAIGGFCTSDKGGSGFPDWYWSSTEDRDFSSCVLVVRFSDGNELWIHKDYVRLSCRPVRLVAASSAPAPVGEVFDFRQEGVSHLII